MAQKSLRFSILMTMLGLMVLPALLWGLGYICFAGMVATIKPAHTEQATDAIIVLTGGNNRISTGLELFAQRKAPNLFISGVNQKTNKEDLIRIWGKNENLPECCISLGHSAGNTEGNAMETEEWLRANHYSSIRLVTANYHILRSLLEFKRAMPGLTIIPHPVRPENFTPWQEPFWSITLREYNKTLLAGLRAVIGETRDMPA